MFFWLVDMKAKDGIRFMTGYSPPGNHFRKDVWQADTLITGLGRSGMYTYMQARLEEIVQDFQPPFVFIYDDTLRSSRPEKLVEKAPAEVHIIGTIPEKKHLDNPDFLPTLALCFRTLIESRSV